MDIMMQFITNLKKLDIYKNSDLQLRILFVSLIAGCVAFVSKSAAEILITIFGYIVAIGLPITLIMIYDGDISDEMADEDEDCV